MKNSFIKLTLLLICTIPLFCFIPHLLGVWKNSPLDRWDGLFILIAIVGVLLFFNRIKSWTLSCNYKGIVALLLAGCIILIGYKTSTHFLIYIGAISLIWSILFFLWGEKIFIGLFPIFLLFALATPASSYWVEFFIQSNADILILSGFEIKGILAILAFIYFIFKTDKISLNGFLFTCTLFLLGGILFLNLTPPKFGNAFFILKDNGAVDHYVGIENPPTVQEHAFFKDCLLKKWVYFKGNSPIYLLSIQIGAHVNTIHPSEICLKSSGHVILNNQEEQLVVGQTVIAYQKIIFRDKNRHFLVYTWYTSDRFSTGNFIIFRRAWNRKTLWHTYQLTTPIQDVASGENDAKKTLESFLKAVIKENQPH